MKILKICPKCEEEKNIDSFYYNKTTQDGRQCYCKQCKRSYDQKDYQKHRQNRLYKQILYRTNNPETIRLWRKNNVKRMKKSNREWHIQNRDCNKEKRKKNIREWQRERRNTDPSYKLRHNISNRIGKDLKKKHAVKESPTWQRLPYTASQLKQHLESQFDHWMSWNNYGRYDIDKRTWNIDHIIPQSKLPYNSMDHPNFLKCWSLNNLRPMEAMANIIKSNNDA